MVVAASQIQHTTKQTVGSSRRFDDGERLQETQLAVEGGVTVKEVVRVERFGNGFFSFTLSESNRPIESTCSRS